MTRQLPRDPVDTVPRVSIQLRLPRELHARLVNLAARDRRSLNAELVIAAESFAAIEGAPRDARLTWFDDTPQSPEDRAAAVERERWATRKGDG